MKKTEAVSFFGSQQAVADALGIHKSSISQWGEDVPALRAYQLKEIMAVRRNGGGDCVPSDDLAA